MISKVLASRHRPPYQQHNETQQRQHVCEMEWTSARVANNGAKREKKKVERDGYAKYQTPIIACENCNDYRDVIARCVRKEDVVLEVGCHVGGTTGLIAAVASRTLGIDASPFWLDEARASYPHARFEECDGFDVAKIKTFGWTFTKIFIDISGSRDLKVLLPLIDCYIKNFQPLVIVVKSFRLKRLLLQCQRAEGFVGNEEEEYAANCRAIEMAAKMQKRRRRNRAELAEASGAEERRKDLQREQEKERLKKKIEGEGAGAMSKPRLLNEIVYYADNKHRLGR